MKVSIVKSARWSLSWQGRFICGWVILLFLAFSAQAQTDAKLEPIGGPGGGQFVARCPQGQLLNGLELRSGDDVDAIKIICVAAYGLVDVGPPVTGGERFGGDGGGNVEQLRCPKENPIVTGMYVRAWGENTLIVTSIGLYCGAAATTQIQRELNDVLHSGRSGVYAGSNEPKRAKVHSAAPLRS